MSIERVPMTKEGYEKKKAELDRMQNVEMLEVARRIATARDMGDLSENAEYHAAREDQGMLQARIDKLKDELSRAFLIDRSTLPKDTVVFGRRRHRRWESRERTVCGSPVRSRQRFARGRHCTASGQR